MKDQKNRMVNERDFRQDPNYVAPDPEKKKLILKLGTMITDRYLVKYSRTMNTDDPEYWAYKNKTPIMIPFIPLYSVAKYKWLVA